MIPTVHEIALEHLLGRRVRDGEGRIVGRIEEMCAEYADGETVVTEFHIGPAAAIERVIGYALLLPFLSLLAREPRLHRVSWRDLDLSDPHRPILKRPVSDLERVPAQRSLR